jgi:hypothetical protein
LADELCIEEKLAFYVARRCSTTRQSRRRMLRDVKTVAEVMNNEALLGELQPDIDEFRNLLKVAGWLSTVI